MIRTLFRLAKSGLAHSLHASGLLRTLVDKKLSGRCAVLMYHRVIDGNSRPLVHSSPGIIVSERQFERQMATLKAEFHPLSLHEFIDYLLSDRAFPDRSCLVTFDDGWVDNFDVALPILKEHSIPAVVFLPCNYVSTSTTFWQEDLLMRLTSMLSANDHSASQMVAEILQDNDVDYSLDMTGLRRFIARLKSEPPDKIDKVRRSIEVMSARFVCSDHYDKHLSWDQIHEMRASGVAFASHALTHRPLTLIKKSECLFELTESRDIIDRQLGESTSAIAYPNGNFDDNVIKLVRTAGYKVGFCTLPGITGPETDPLAIPRLNIHGRNGQNPARFMCTIANLF